MYRCTEYVCACIDVYMRSCVQTCVVRTALHNRKLARLSLCLLLHTCAQMYAYIHMQMHLVACGAAFPAALTDTRGSMISCPNFARHLYSKTHSTAHARTHRNMLTHSHKHVPTHECIQVRLVACGAAFSAALTDTGELFTWGQNSAGQLGHADFEKKPSPTPVGGLLAKRRVGQMACGYEHMIVLTTGMCACVHVCLCVCMFKFYARGVDMSSRNVLTTGLLVCMSDSMYMCVWNVDISAREIV
jgi:alpha-tubulin suppressor-like RCC1 family protein